MFEKGLEELLELQSRVAHIHPLFEKHYPVVLVETHRVLFYTFEDDKYKLLSQRPNIDDWSSDIRAAVAFPVRQLNYEVACVVGAEALNDLTGTVIMLHEFVHCYQARTCRHKLAETLEIAQEAMLAKNYSWELNHPFPYSDPDFVSAFSKYLEATPDTLLEARKRVLEPLTPKDREYMVWQEWVEGFARYLENHIQTALGLPVNQYGSEPPFNRIAFYASGAKTIAHLVALEPALETDLEALYHRLNQT